MKIIPSSWSRSSEETPTDPDQTNITETDTAIEPLSRKERRAANKAARDASKAARKEAKQAASQTPSQEAPQKGTTSTFDSMTKKLTEKLAEKAHAPRMTPDARKGLMGLSRNTTLFLIIVLVISATGAAFLESFEALHQWAKDHGLKGFWAFIFPLQIDAFLAIGELALFLAIIDHWHWKNRVVPWISVLIGLTASLWANVGHIRKHLEYPNADLASTQETREAIASQALAWDITAAIPPLAALAGMMVGLRILKQIMRPSQEALRLEAEEAARVSQPEPIEEPEPAEETEDELKPEHYLARWTEEIQVSQNGSSNGSSNGSLNGHKKVEPEHKEEPKIQQPKRSPGRRVLSGPDHPKWEEGVKLYRESMERGDALSQRDLATALEMKNRNLAALIIAHVNGTTGV